MSERPTYTRVVVIHGFQALFLRTGGYEPNIKKLVVCEHREDIEGNRHWVEMPVDRVNADDFEPVFTRMAEELVRLRDTPATGEEGRNA